MRAWVHEFYGERSKFSTVAHSHAWQVLWPDLSPAKSLGAPDPVCVGV